MGKNNGKNISRNLSSTYSQKLLDLAIQFTTDTPKTTSKTKIQKTTEATGDLIGNKVADAGVKSYDGKITKVSKNYLQNSLETVKNENDKEIPKKRYTSAEERLKIIDHLRLI